jgi:hypothetical protein
VAAGVSSETHHMGAMSVILEVGRKASTTLAMKAMAK